MYIICLKFKYVFKYVKNKIILSVIWSEQGDFPKLLIKLKKSFFIILFVVRTVLFTVKKYHSDKLQRIISMMLKLNKQSNNIGTKRV